MRQDNALAGVCRYQGVGVMAGDRWYVTKDREPYQDNTSPFRI